MPYPKCEECDGSRKQDGTPDALPCEVCRCEGCSIVTGRQMVKCADGGEWICEACMNAETSDGCPVLEKKRPYHDGLEGIPRDFSRKNYNS